MRRRKNIRSKTERGWRKRSNMRNNTSRRKRGDRRRRIINRIYRKKH